MADGPLGSSTPIVSVRPGRNRLADEDRTILEERRKRLKKHESEKDEAPEHGSDFQGFGHDHDQIFDDVSVLGIPKAEMTESVRTAINLLFVQINQLRAELANAKGHEAYLEEQVEKDRLLHVMRQRAFMSRLSLAVRRVEEESALFCFLYIKIQNALSIRERMGHGAHESLMVHAADVLRERLEPGDIIGSLENSDFGIILPGTSPLDADLKGRNLMADMAAKTFPWQGENVQIFAHYAITEIYAGDGGEQIVVRSRKLCEADGA